jgi:hypothetical protein
MNLLLQRTLIMQLMFAQYKFNNSQSRRCISTREMRELINFPNFELSQLAKVRECACCAKWKGVTF